MIIVVVFGICLTCVYMFFSLKTQWKYRSLWNVPSPLALPILGHAHIMGNTINYLQTLEELTKKYGPTIKLWAGSFTCDLVTSDLEFIEFILNDPKFINKPVEYLYFKPWLGRTPFICEDMDLWRKKRKLITSGFHFQILESFLPIFHKQADALAKNLKKHSEMDIFDIYPYVTAYTLDVICETTMGVQKNVQKSSSLQQINEYAESIHNILTSICNRVCSALKKSDLLYSLTTDYRLEKQAIKCIKEFDIPLISQRKEELIRKKDCFKDECDELGVKKKKIILDILLEATIDGKPLSDEDIIEDVHGVIFGGHDTVSSALTYAFYAISNHPHIQEKMVEELKMVFGKDKDNIPTMQQLQEMKYTEMVLKETMRYYTTVPWIGRLITEDVYYKDLLLPKGLQIGLMFYLLHKNPQLYPNPEKFDPERFLNPQSKSLFSFVPFSAGARNCPGQKFAYLEMKVVMANVLRNFELLPAGPGYDVTKSGEIIMKSTTGMHLRVRPRNFSS